jgi:hypothetical protein
MIVLLEEQSASTCKLIPFVSEAARVILLWKTTVKLH